MRRLLAVIAVLGATVPVFGDDVSPEVRLYADEAMEQTVEDPALSGPLEEVIAELSARAGVPIQADWKAIEATGASRDAQVSIRASKASFGQLLDIALLQASEEGRPLAWYAEGPKVHVTTQMRAIYRRRPAPAVGRTARRDASPPAQRRGVGLQFQEAGLEEVIEFFRDVSGANFHVNWSSLESVGIDRRTPMSLRLSNVTIAQALDMVCDRLSGTRGKMQRVYWVIDDGVVHIATGEVLNRRTETRVFDIADLLMVAPDYPAPDVGLGRMDGADDAGSVGTSELLVTGDTAAADDGEATLRRQRREDLLAVIRESIGEDMWRPVGKGSVRIVGNHLVITQTPLGFKLLSQAINPR
ncbi:MAG: hypothetical protein ACP5HU_04535 [Phycisphaerae bacterium]